MSIPLIVALVLFVASILWAIINPAPNRTQINALLLAVWALCAIAILPGVLK